MPHEALISVILALAISAILVPALIRDYRDARRLRQEDPHTPEAEDDSAPLPLPLPAVYIIPDTQPTPTVTPTPPTEDK